MAPKKNQNKTVAPLPTTGQAAAKAPATTFSPSEADVSLMREIDTVYTAGNVRHVSSAEAAHLVSAGLVEVDTNATDAAGNVAARLTEAGKVHIMNAPAATPAVENQTAAPVGAAPATGTSTAAVSAAAPAVAAPISFSIAKVSPPKVNRTPPKGGGAKPKYPQLDSLEEGYGMFIPAPADVNTPEAIKKMSKGFGSMMADRNSKDETKYFTSRTIKDGKEAGFTAPYPADAIDPATGQPYPAGTQNPDAYAGVMGTGLYRLPLSERKVRKPKAAAAKTPDQIAAEAAAAANAGVAGIPGAPGTDEADAAALAASQGTAPATA